MIVPVVTGADSPDWTVAELGRVAFTYRLDPALIAGSLELQQQEAVTIAAGEQPSIGFDPDRQARAALLLNILVRVEIRCGHDPAAIRAALDRPLDLLAGDSIADRLRAGPDLAALRRLREAAGAMPVAKVKMWRVPDRYS